MKKITLVIGMIIASYGYSQCTGVNHFPSDTFVVKNFGAVEEISTINFTGDYTALSGLVFGNDYVFTCQEAAITHKYITVTDLSNIVIAQGASPLNVSSITATDVKLHFHDDAVCNTTNLSHKTTVQCVSASCVLPTPPSNDACANAISVTALPYNNTQDAIGATDNSGSIITCGDGMNDGVWYTFTTLVGGTVNITVSGNTGWDPEICVYSGSCGTFTCVANVDDGADSVSESLSGVIVTAGTQYWINIGDYEYSSERSEGPLVIDISSVDTTTLGIEDLKLSENFNFYPNPVKNVLNVSAKNTIEHLTVINLLGQVVKKVTPNLNSIELDFSDLNTGIYFVKATVGNTSGTFRIIKE